MTTLKEIFTETFKWLGDLYDVGELNDVIQRARSVIKLTEEKAKQWWNWAKLLAIVCTATAVGLFLITAIIGSFAQTGWPNALAGLVIALLLFVLLFWWTPLVAIIAVVSEIAHLRFRSVPGVAVARAKWWLGLTCGVLLWQVITSLAFTFIPYWNAPSRIPVMMLLALAMALIGIKWGGGQKHRKVIKALVVVAFITQVSVCFVPQLATLATVSTSRLDRNVLATAKRVEREGFFPATPPASAKTPGPIVPALAGKTLTVELQPDQVYDIDDLRQGQKWRYLSFNGAFSHRVDKGDDKACWKLVDNNLPWTADYAGKLQVKAGNATVKLTVNIVP